MELGLGYARADLGTLVVARRDQVAIVVKTITTTITTTITITIVTATTAMIIREPGACGVCRKDKARSNVTQRIRTRASSSEEIYIRWGSGMSRNRRGNVMHKDKGYHIRGA